MRTSAKKWIKFLIWALIFFAIIYGSGRLYYCLTGGFTEDNITYALPYDSRWNTHPLDNEELENVRAMLNLNYHYLGKGCQSYVFESENGEYVLKFFKYQRFRPQPWLSYLSFLPGMEEYLKQKVQKKREKLDSVFSSWKIAYEDLQPETGVVYVHLNKSKNINTTLNLYDKMGFKHELDSDNYEFMLQRKAKMLCPVINQLISQKEPEKARILISQLVQMILSEYYRGYADNDHALMQNTGVLNGQPIHIDVGQFVKNQRVKNPDVYRQELFNKTWKFRKWLEKHHPELSEHLVVILKELWGEEIFAHLKPYLNKADVGVISQEDEDNS